jgi:predicted ATP-grasp superfamily ATP-dependent carboligase
MLDEIKRNKFKASLFGESPNMSKIEKKISFLNRYFVYKKVREVNIDKLNLELGEYEEAVIQRERSETKQAVVVAKEEDLKLRPKIRKLQKKILLVAATEAVDEPAKAIEKAIEKEAKQKATKKTNKAKKVVIIESDEED